VGGFVCNFFGMVFLGGVPRKMAPFFGFFVVTTWWNRGESVVFRWSQIRFEKCANFLNFIFCASDTQVYGASAWRNMRFDGC
jgi:hypothetical protein